MDDEKTFDEIIEEVIQLLDDKKYKQTRDVLLEYNPADIADILNEVLDEASLDEAIIAFRMLPKDISVDVFSFLSIDDQVAIINGITDREINYIVSELDFDDKIDVLDELPANVVDKILEKTPKNERSQINTFLNYPDNCAGTLMTPEYISLQIGWTVDDALKHIKKAGMDTETIYTCYVKESGRKLFGIVSLRSLVVNDGDTPVSALVATDFVSVNVFDDQEEVYDKFRKYGLLAIPVVDNEERLVGIITMDDILDVGEEETTEDIERMSGIIDSGTSEYLDTSVWKQVKNRLPWLLGLMCSYIITGGIIAGFENALSACISLVTYMPMLMGTGGNSGSQSATLIIRGLAVGDVALKDWARVLWKEIRVSFIIGVCLSAFNFVRIFCVEGHMSPEAMPIAITVCVAMILIVIGAKCIGSMLPLLAKKIGIDPALMASPMISSLTDLVSVLTYFMLAVAILKV